ALCPRRRSEVLHVHHRIIPALPVPDHQAGDGPGLRSPPVPFHGDARRSLLLAGNPLLLQERHQGIVVVVPALEEEVVHFYRVRASGTIRDRRIRLSRVRRGTECTTLVAAMISSAGSPRKSSA